MLSNPQMLMSPYFSKTHINHVKKYDNYIWKFSQTSLKKINK